MPSVRRLTAILAADVAGYSRLMGADEEGTHERLRAHLRDLIEPKITGHRGRIVKNTGDGFLAEFASVVDAVRCAVEMQRGMAGILIFANLAQRDFYKETAGCPSRTVGRKSMSNSTPAIAAAFVVCATSAAVVFAQQPTDVAHSP